LLFVGVRENVGECLLALQRHSVLADQVVFLTDDESNERGVILCFAGGRFHRQTPGRRRFVLNFADGDLLEVLRLPQVAQDVVDKFRG